MIYLLLKSTDQFIETLLHHNKLIQQKGRENSEVDPDADEVTFDEFMQVGIAAQAIIEAKIAGDKQSLYPMWGNYE